MRTVCLLVAMCVSLAACGDDSSSPPNGAIAAEVITTGVDRDATFEITAAGRTLATTGTPPRVPFVDVPVGTYNVSIAGIAANCTAVGETTKSATVVSGTTAIVQFTVNCTAINPV